MTDLCYIFQRILIHVIFCSYHTLVRSTQGQNLQDHSHSRQLQKIIIQNIGNLLISQIWAWQLFFGDYR